MVGHRRGRGGGGGIRRGGTGGRGVRRGRVWCYGIRGGRSGAVRARGVAVVPGVPGRWGGRGRLRGIDELERRGRREDQAAEALLGRLGTVPEQGVGRHHGGGPGRRWVGKTVP